MMSAMEHSTVSRPADSEPTPAKATKLGTTDKAYGNRHFKPTQLPDLGSAQLFPDWVHNFFRRKDKPAAR